MDLKENKEKMINDDILTDDIMRAAADMIQTEIEIDILVHEQMEIDIPAEFDEKMLAMARQLDEKRKAKERNARWKRVFRIAAVFLICMVSIGSITMMTSEAFRKKVIQLFSNQDAGAVTLRSGDEEELIGDWENFWYPVVLPEGFNLIAAEEADHFLLYSNENGTSEFRIFEQSMDVMVSVDTDSTDVKKLKIGYSDGYFFKEKDTLSYCVTWRTETTSIMMYFDGDWTETKILEIAESMTYIETF